MLLRTLGGLKLQEVNFYQTKPLLLLAYLALEGPKVRRQLWKLFWPEATNPANSLRVTVHKLKVLPECVQIVGERVAVQLQTDAQELLKALEVGDPSALTLYQGPFLEGVELSETSTELEEWVYGTREFLAQRVRGALLQRAEAEASQGRVGVAAGYAEQAYSLAGAPELEPEEIERLYALLLGGGSPHATLLRREAGEVGIVLTLVTNARPTLAQTAATTAHNLPRRNTAFIGRDLELLEVAGLLAQTETRLVTLTGPGGIGKTRLALQAAWEELTRNSFDGGVYLVPLENMTSADLILVGVANALGVKQGQAELLAAVVEKIDSRTTLIILDNFEHLLEGAEAVSQLLARCPNLKIMVTSRERLNLEEEWTLPISGLSVPKTLPDEKTPRGDAVQLFVQRAKRAFLEFVLTAQNAPYVLQICHLVGGSPLGLELAAAWVRVLSPEEIAQEIAKDLDFLTTTSRNRTERHKSVRAAFEHSWRLLAPSEQTVLGGLSVFRGGFRRDAASEVVGATIPVLASLIDKSLLRASPGGRYDRHPLIYRFAEEKLGEREQAQLGRAHANYFLELAEVLNAKLQATRDFSELGVLEQEHENLRAALRWSLAQDGILALRLGGALGLFWETRGYLSEGRRWLKAARARQPDAPASVRAQALTVLGRLTQLQGEVFAARGPLEEALALWRLTDDTAGTAEALNRLGTAVIAEADYTRAETYFQEALALHQTRGNTRGVATLLNNLGELARYQNDFGEARKYYEASLALQPEEISIRHRAIVLGNLGSVLWRTGDNSLAEMVFTESLTLKYEVRDEIGLSYCFAGLAGTAYAKENFGRAALLLGVVDALIERTQHQLDPVDRRDAERTSAQTRSQLGATVFTEALTEGHALTLEQAVKYVLDDTNLHVRLLEKSLSAGQGEQRHTRSGKVE